MPGRDIVEHQVAVIVPAYNEIGGIEDTLSRVRAVLSDLGGTSEIIVVDDGSTDGTGARAAACGARVVAHAMNRGYGAALKTGVLSTTAPWVMIMDADCSYPPEAIQCPRLLPRHRWIAAVMSTGRPEIAALTTFT